MLICADHLVAGMRLARDIELQAGSYLITRRDLSEGVLTPNVIESIQKFSHQFVPYPDKVVVEDDEFTVRHVRKVLSEDLHRIMKQVTSGQVYPNFLTDGQIQVKVMRVMDMLFSNPDIVRIVYESKFSDETPKKPADLIIEHNIRVTLLSLALGLKMGWTIIGLMSLGTAALLHESGLFDSEISARMVKLDQCSEGEVRDFVEDHQARTVELLQNQQLSISSYHLSEIINIVAGHHKPDHDETGSRAALLFYFVDLLDEMVSALPHALRYNFSEQDIKILGKKFRRRVGLVELLTGLNKLYGREGGLRQEIVSNLAQIFSMPEVMVEDFPGKLQEIIDWCPFDSASAHPVYEGNFTPRTIYCSRSNEEGFDCRHMVYVNVEVKDEGGKSSEYLKCGALDPRLKSLIGKPAD
jgi:hypothetical protein